ncbi:MAG: hydroxymethylbilane synthase [Parvularculaceae bacterium]
MSEPFRIGTRSSVMALAQTDEVARALEAAWADILPEIVRFTPQGDRDLTARLDAHGGKGGAFVAEIRAAMLRGEIEAAMHSLKDMPGDEETPGLVAAAYLTRGSAADALVLRPGVMLAAFEQAKGSGFRIGTDSVRRAAFLRRLYPQAEIIHYRGAADTRVRKLDEGALQKLPVGAPVGPADALVMAAAGLKRVGLEARIARAFSPDEMLPSAGQGIVAVECPGDAWETRRRLAAIDDRQARVEALAERETLWVLNGHCHSPIGAHATLKGERMRLKAAVLSLDGREIIEAESEGAIDRPRELGRAVALELLAGGALALIEKSRF